MCKINPGSVDIPLAVTNANGDEIEMMKDTAVIWPWDFFHTFGAKANSYNGWLTIKRKLANAHQNTGPIVKA